MTLIPSGSAHSTPRREARIDHGVRPAASSSILPLTSSSRTYSLAEAVQYRAAQCRRRCAAGGRVAQHHLCQVSARLLPLGKLPRTRKSTQAPAQRTGAVDRRAGADVARTSTQRFYQRAIFQSLSDFTKLRAPSAAHMCERGVVTPQCQVKEAKSRSSCRHMPK